MDGDTESKQASSPAALAAEQFFELWQMPLRFWTNWLEACFSIPPTHRLTSKEMDDRRHAQLVVPEPIKSSPDRELFA